MIRILLNYRLLILVDIAVNSFVMKSRLSWLALQFPTDLFGREPTSESGYDSSQQGAFEFVRRSLLGCSCPLLGLLGIIFLLRVVLAVFG